MRFRTGTIVLFKYRRYKKDPQPLILVLYGGDKYANIHGLNLHYLSNQLTDELIGFIAKIISRELSYRDMKKLYHDYMKHKLPSIISNAYRTYKPREARDGAIISDGFNETVNILQKFKKATNRLTEQDLERIQSKIKTQVLSEKEIEKRLPDNTSVDELADAVRNYVKMLSDASKGFLDKKELRRYTR